jgi:uncharacterized protein (TIGR02996 family)
VDDAFLRQILAHPFDDGPRLVYADRLDERGDPRGEFIRAQVELARWGYDGPLTIRTARLQAASHQPAQHSLVDRAARLLSECATAWCQDLGVDAATAYEWGWSRGFVAAVTLTAAQFFGGPCERCDETGCILDPKSGEQFYDPCPACRDPETGESTGRVEGLAAALFRAAPVTEVRLSDREPLRIFDGWGFSRGSDGTRRPEMTRHVIPPEVFDLIPTARDHLDEHPEAGWIRFRNGVTDAPEELLFLTSNRAHAALSVACVAYGRSSVHPPAAESKR